MPEHWNHDDRSIADRLRGRELLVTGATGLLAKVFVEKLLRCVPEVGKIHLLLRPRNDGTEAADRLTSEVIGSPVFDRLRALLGPRFDDLCAEKLASVEGDITLDRFGLSDADYKTLADRVDIVVNSAATVTFDERLDLAAAINLEGPQRLLTLARDAGAAYMQVSTCYVSGRRTGEIIEALSGPPMGVPIDIDVMHAEIARRCAAIQSQRTRDNEKQREALVAAGMELAQTHGWNDTYTFTKWLGEQFIDRERGDVPVVILRPAIIEGSYDEPVPGWIDGLRMADPIIVAYGSGKLSEFPADPEVCLDVIPVDIVSNAMIVTLPTADDGPGLEVFQSASSARNPLRLKALKEYLEAAFRQSPMVDDLGRPIPPKALQFVTPEEFDRKWQARLARARWSLEQLDRLNILPTRRRQLTAAVSRIEQLLYFSRIYAVYTHLKCFYRDDRLRARVARLSEADQARFPTRPEVVDWRDYFVNRHVPGLRRFALGGARDGQPVRPAERRPFAPNPRLHEKFDRVASIYAAAAESAAQNPGKVALQMNRKGRWIRYSYAQVVATAGVIAQRFSECGLEPGDRVALIGDNGPEWPLTYLAIMRAGMTAVPLDVSLPADEVIECSAFAGAKLIAAGSTRYADIAAALEHRAERENIKVVELNDRFVPPPGAARDEGPPAIYVTRDQPASILFTSGTTLKPKAVQLSHENLLANASGIVRMQPLGECDNFLSVLPMHHAFEFTGGFLVPLGAGATITFVEQLKGPTVVAAMQSTGTSVMLVVPRLLKLFHDSIERKVEEAGPLARSAFRALHRVSDLTGRRLGRKLFDKVHQQFGGNLRLFVSGASALDPTLFESFSRMGFVLAEGYGLTETGPVLTVNPAGRERAGSAGKVLPNVEIEIRDADGNGVGELWARGPNIMRGYLDNEEATAATIVDGWFRTGDLCRQDNDGYIYIAGRAKDLIVTEAGKNVYPDEVEVRYRALPFVRELCVVGVPNASNTGEIVCAVIVADVEAIVGMDEADWQSQVADVAATVAERIPSHQRIQTFHFWGDELPKTSTMKAKRNVIRDAIVSGRLSHTLQHAARPRRAPAVDPSERPANHRRMYDVLSKLTKTPSKDIQPHSHLLQDLGVDSLMKLYVIAELEKHYALSCSDEVTASVTRVNDLLLLIGEREPAEDVEGGERAWRSRLHKSETANGATANGALPLPLLPARWAARGGMSLFFHTYVRVRANGGEHIPASGAFILAANHTSHLDAASVMTAANGRRRIWAAAAEDYFFDTALKRWVFGRLFDAIPIDRNAGGVTGMRACIDKLEHGEGVLVLPEGTRSLDGRIQEFKIGAAVLAYEVGVPIVPTRIEHAFNLLPKGKRIARPGVIHVSFGKPIFPDAVAADGDIGAQHRAYQSLIRRVRDAVIALGAPSPLPADEDAFA